MLRRAPAASVVARLPGVRPAVHALQTLRFQWRHGGNGPIVVVHQMARVGSITVVRALRRALPHANLFHTHYLNPATIRYFEAESDRIFAVTGRPGLHRELLAARWLAPRLRDGVRRPWRVVSLVRDPIARTVSAFFRHFAYAHPQLGAPFRDDIGNVQRLLRLYLEASTFEHDFALGWFDREVRDVFGIDVYAQPFPHAAGHAVYADGGGACELLVMRLEDLDRIGAGALERFLGATGVQFATENSADRESYAASYRALLEELRLTNDYLDRMYGSRLARHFYSDHELAAFRARWERAT